MGTLGVHRVCCDQCSGQVEVFEQRGERGDLVGFVRDLALRHDRSGPTEHGGQHVHGASVPGSGAAQRLAVHDHLLGVEAGVEPGAEYRIELITVAGLQGASDGRLAGHHVTPGARVDADFECAQHPSRGVRSPLPGGDVGPGPSNHRSRG